MEHMSNMLTEKRGLRRSGAAPHLFACSERGLVLELHADDYHASGNKEHLMELQKIISEG